MQARGFGREDINVLPIPGTKANEVAVRVARRDGSKRSLVAIVDAAYHVLNEIRSKRFDGEGRVLELRDSAAFYVKNWRKAAGASKKTATRKAAIEPLINEWSLKDYVSRALDPISSMRGFEGFIDAMSGKRRIRIMVTGPNELYLHKSTQTVLDRAAVIVEKEIAPKFGGLPRAAWSTYHVEWSVAGTWPQAIKKWKDAAKKPSSRTKTRMAEIRGARLKREAGKTLSQIEREDRAREVDYQATQDKARARNEKRAAAELAKQLQLLRTAAKKIEKMIDQLAKGSGDLQKVRRAIDNLHGRVDKRGIDRESAYAIIEPLSAKANAAADAGDKERQAARERESSDAARKHSEQQRAMSSYDKELAMMSGGRARDE